MQASFASRTMIYSGLLILAFVLFHIAHFTLGLVQSCRQRRADRKTCWNCTIPTSPNTTNDIG